MNPPDAALKLRLSTTALALLVLLGLFAPGNSAQAAAKRKSYECQHPVITGEQAVNPKGISPKEACKVVLSLGKYLSSQANVKKLYKCTGPRSHTPVLLMDEFEGWKLKLTIRHDFIFVMSKPGASFRVTGQDFPVNCS